MSQRSDTGKSKLYTGTSGIAIPIPQSQYPGSFKGKSRLAYYSSLLNSLEVNSSFYRLPKLTTVQKWVSEVPDDFTFTFKISKSISHAKNLVFDEDDVYSFLDVVKSAENKLHCILIQLPPSTNVSVFDQLRRLLELIQDHSSVNIAVECRNESWYYSDVFQLLKDHQTSIVIHDYKKGRFSKQIDQPFYYYRFHGMDSNYRGDYSDEILKTYANEMAPLLKKGKTVYCYFNNTMGGAFENAKRIKELITQSQ